MRSGLHLGQAWQLLVDLKERRSSVVTVISLANLQMNPLTSLSRLQKGLPFLSLNRPEFRSHMCDIYLNVTHDDSSEVDKDTSVWCTEG